MLNSMAKRKQTPEERSGKWLFAIGMTLLAATLFGLFCRCTGTRTVEVPVEVERTVMRTDTLRLMKLTRDTVIDRDTVFMRLTGDTLVKEVTRWRWRISEQRDTVWQTKTDSVYIEKPVTMTVTKSSSVWQRSTALITVLSVALVILLLTSAILYKYNRLKK